MHIVVEVLEGCEANIAVPQSPKVTWLHTKTDRQTTTHPLTQSFNHSLAHTFIAHFMVHAHLHCGNGSISATVAHMVVLTQLILAPHGGVLYPSYAPHEPQSPPTKKLHWP